MGRRKKVTGFMCPDCNVTMEPYDDDTYICECCKGRYIYDEGDWEFMDGTWFDEFEDCAPSRPQVCTGCGSDMYPDCQYSCKLFDD